MGFNRSLFRKRRKGGRSITPFTPLSINGCVLWLDGNDPTTIPTDPVQSWLDKSGHSNNAAFIPVAGLADVETWPLNSNTALEFTASNFGMLQINSSASLIVGDYSLFTVCARLSALTENGYYVLQPELGCKPSHGYYDDSGTDVFYTHTCDTGIGDIDISPVPQYLCAGSLVGSNLMDTRLNKSVLLTNQPTFTNSAAQFYVIGGIWAPPNYFALCDLAIAEIVLYDNRISAGDVVLLEDYLYTKWSLP